MVCIGRLIDDLLADPKHETNKDYSVEFCGGTHLSNTQEATAFALISEEGMLRLKGLFFAVAQVRASSCRGEILLQFFLAHGSSAIGIAKGVRRIVAFTGLEAEKAIAEGQRIADEIETARKLPESDLETAVSAIKQVVHRPLGMHITMETLMG